MKNTEQKVLHPSKVYVQMVDDRTIIKKGDRIEVENDILRIYFGEKVVGVVDMVYVVGAFLDD